MCGPMVRWKEFVVKEYVLKSSVSMEDFGSMERNVWKNVCITILSREMVHWIPIDKYTVS